MYTYKIAHDPGINTLNKNQNTIGPISLNMMEQELQLIDLDIPELGYLKFISSWLYRGSEGTFLMDPGPTCTIPILLKALDRYQVKDLDWILLTHIHQDHAGGLGDLIGKYSNAKIVCHEKGVKHLAEPSKLREGSKTILGDVSKVYGNILPVPGKKIHVLDEVPFGDGIKVITTPGHASHHQCYVFKNWFFAGELFGAHIPMKSGLYLRPATPHRFILEDYLASMAKIEKYLDPKTTVCFAHYGTANNSKHVLICARDQLKLWVKIIREHKDKKNTQELIEILLEVDPIFRRYKELDLQMQKREWHFSVNSIMGIIKYIEEKKMLCKTTNK